MIQQISIGFGNQSNCFGIIQVELQTGTEMAYQNYPLQIVFLTNLFNLLIYATGIVILLDFGWIFAGVYILYIIILEIRLLRFHCPDCFYYGKVCAFGKGYISSLVFKKGDPQRFTCRNVNFWHLIPDLMVFIIPLMAGILSLILGFQWATLIALAALIILNTGGNAYIRGKVACRNCQQGEIGCPALDFFNNPKSS